MPSKESESVLTRFTAAVKSSSGPVSHARDSIYTSVGFKSVSTTQIKAQHSGTSVSPFYSIWCSVRWRAADGGHLFTSVTPKKKPNPLDGGLNFGNLAEDVRRVPPN